MLNIADLYVFFILRTYTDKTTAVYTQSWVQLFPEDKYTVDGSEILQSPADVGSLSQIFTRFFTSQVVQDFWIINSIKGLKETKTLWYTTPWIPFEKLTESWSLEKFFEC